MYLSTTPEQKKNDKRHPRRSPRTPLNQLSKSALSPGSSPDSAMIIPSDDESEPEMYSHQTAGTPISQMKAPRHDSTKSLPILTEKRALPQSASGIYARPSLQEEVVSEPLLGASGGQSFRDSSNPKEHLPCGKPSFMITEGNCHQAHKKNCIICQEALVSSPNVGKSTAGQTRSSSPVSGSKKTITMADSSVEDSRDTSPRSKKATHDAQKTYSTDDHQVSLDLNFKLGVIARQSLTECESPGFLYFLSASNKPGLLKVGYSVDPVNRKQQHQRKCKLEMLYQNYSIYTRHMKRAEKLLKADMKHLKKEWTCKACSREHGEWFEVGVEQAYVIAKRWTEWLKRAPYDGHGELHEFWKETILTTNHAVDFASHDHNARWSHWSELLSQPLPVVEENISRPGVPRESATQANGAASLPPHQIRASRQLEQAMRITEQLSAARIPAADRHVQSGGSPAMIVNNYFNIQIRGRSISAEL